MNFTWCFMQWLREVIANELHDITPHDQQLHLNISVKSKKIHWNISAQRTWAPEHRLNWQIVLHAHIGHRWQKDWFVATHPNNERLQQFHWVCRLWNAARCYRFWKEVFISHFNRSIAAFRNPKIYLVCTHSNTPPFWPIYWRASSIWSVIQQQAAHKMIDISSISFSLSLSCFARQMANRWSTIAFSVYQFQECAQCSCDRSLPSWHNVLLRCCSLSIDFCLLKT